MTMSFSVNEFLVISCTQDILPEAPKAAPVNKVSQYACQRRTTTENYNKIFTVRNSLNALTFSHLRPTVLLCNGKLPQSVLL